jgi:two-component system, OmpR family, phosphate regulon sensor histidine kinase PhoR
MNPKRLSRFQLSQDGDMVWSLVLRLAGAVLLAFALGFIFGGTGWWLALLLGIYLAYQFYRLFDIHRWLRFRTVLPPPDVSGPWGEVVAIVARLYRRKQFHKQRVHMLMREFQRLTAGMPEGAALLGSNNELLWFNQKAERWLGLKRRRDVGIRIGNLVRFPAFTQYLQQGDFSHPVVVHQHAHVAGEAERWLSIHIVQAEGAAQRLLIARDITREMLLETMRKDFVANASHELRSPLTVISGYLDALGDDESLETLWRQPVQEMRRQATRMHQLIEELLRLSRLEEDNSTAVQECVDAPGLLALLRKETLALEARPEHVEFSIESGACLLGSESELQSLFGNLVSNAVKYTPRDGSISVRWWSDDEGAHMSVTDTGIGIAPEHLPRLTERFYRVDAGRSRDMGGFGLGLAIVKHVLQRHDATLTVDSEPGRGSCFTCHFPPERVTVRQYHAATAS